MFRKVATLSKTAILGTILGFGAVYSPGALANCTTDTDSTWECLEVGGTDLTSSSLMSGPYTYEGIVSVYHSLTGTISACGSVWGVSLNILQSLNLGNVQVSDATSSGPGNCAKISFGGFNWSTAIDGSGGGDVYDKHGGSHNAFGDLGLLEIYYDSLFGNIKLCEGTLGHVEFGNDLNYTDNNDPSFIRFSGTVDGCTLIGLLTTDGYTDVNFW